MATTPAKSAASKPGQGSRMSKEKYDQIMLTAERARARAEKEKAEKAARRKKELETEAKTTKIKPPADGGISDLPIEEQLKEIELQKKIKKAEEQARDLSGKRPQGLKNGGMVTTCRGQGRVMKKRQTRMT